MPYGVPDELWRKLPPEDQNEIINEFYGKQVVPDIGGYAPPPPPTPTPEPPRATQGSKPPEITWAYVRSLNSFPGNHPYFADDRKAGIGGYFLEQHDPYLAFGAEACRAAGFLVGVWSDPHGADPQTYAHDLVTAAHSIGADAISPDPEITGKGGPGTPGWEWNQAAAAAIRALDAHITVIVTPTPDQDDFNYGAWTGTESLVWVQLYGEKLTDLYNAEEVIKRVIANGVPANRVGALIPAGAIAQYVAELQRLGVTHWAIYTIDDVNTTDRETPFGPPAPEGGSQPPPDTPDDSAPDTGQDVSVDDYDDSVYDVSEDVGVENSDDPPDSLGDTSADLFYLLTSPNSRSLEGRPSLAPSLLRDKKAPQYVIDAIKNDLLLRKVPSNIAAGIRMALLIIEKGIPYVWGGTDPNRGLDCSGYVGVVYRAAGYKGLARRSQEQSKQGRAVSKAHLQPLDLLFFERGRDGPGHVAMYMAAGWAVHEPHTGEVAQWLNLAQWSPYLYRRYFKNVKGTYSPEQNVPKPEPPQTVDIGTVSGHWHTLMQAMDGDRHQTAKQIRDTANNLLGIVS